VHTRLRLSRRMTVIPVGAVLPDAKLVSKSFARLDTREADAGHAIHVGRHQHTVPMNRREVLQAVSHAQGDILTFSQPDLWTGYGAIDRPRRGHAIADTKRGLTDGQIDCLPAQRRQLL